MTRLEELEKLKHSIDVNEGCCIGMPCYNCCLINECSTLMHYCAETYYREKREIIERELAKIYVEEILLGSSNE